MARCKRWNGQRRSSPELQREFPKFRIVRKRTSRLSLLIDVLLKVLTFGAQREFLTRYHTVLFDVLYVPDRWEETDI